MDLDFMRKHRKKYGSPPRPLDVTVGEYRARYFQKWSGNTNSPLLMITMNDVEVTIYTNDRGSSRTAFDDSKAIYASKNLRFVPIPDEVWRMRDEINFVFAFPDTYMARRVLALVGCSLERADGDHVVLWRVFGFLRHSVS